MLGGMLRGGFRSDLDRLDRRVSALGRDVERFITLMVEVLEDHDVAEAERNVGYDRHLKVRGEEIENDCMLLQARQAPVACDLRRVQVVRAISEHIVRAGTLCEHAFRTVAGIGDECRETEIEGALIEMARASRGLFRDGLAAFERCDIDGVGNLRAADERVDLLCAEVMRLATVDGGHEVPVPPGYPAQAALVAHYLERIADHGVDVGLSTIFLVTGEPA